MGPKYLDPSEIQVLASAVDSRFQKGDARLKITRFNGFSSLGPYSTGLIPTQEDKNCTGHEEGDDDDPCDDCEEVVRQYFMEKVVPRNTYPLQWWKMNELKFKNLSIVARSILCVPATSKASEWLFSTGLIVTDLRSSLEPENVDGFVFKIKITGDLIPNP